MHSCYCFIFLTEYRAFSHDVTAAMLVFQTNPEGVKLFSCVNTFFCFTKLICIDASYVSEKALLILLPTVYEPTYTYSIIMALLFMSLAIAQLDRLPFGVLEVMTSNHVRVSRI